MLRLFKLLKSRDSLPNTTRKLKINDEGRNWRL